MSPAKQEQAVRLTADMQSACVLTQVIACLETCKYHKANRMGCCILRALISLAQVLSLQKLVTSHVQVLQHAAKAWGQRRDTDHTLPHSQIDEILRLIEAADCLLAASLHCIHHCKTQHAKAASHLIGKHTVCLFHFLQQLQG